MDYHEWRERRNRYVSARIRDLDRNDDAVRVCLETPRGPLNIRYPRTNNPYNFPIFLRGDNPSTSPLHWLSDTRLPFMYQDWLTNHGHILMLI